MLGRAIIPEIDELVRNRDFATLRDIFEDWHSSEIADAVADLHENERAIVFRLLSKERASRVFEYLDLRVQKSLLKALGREEVASIVDNMSPDDRTALLQELPGPIVRQLIDYLSPKERSVARTLLGYPADSVCRLMTPEYVAIEKGWTVDQVLDHIRRHATEVESLDFVYVVDDAGRLLDDIRIRDLLVVSLDRPVQDLMNESFVSLTPRDTQEQAVQVFKQYDRSALPVVNNDGFLLGIVTIDDVMDVVEQINTQDIQKPSTIPTSKRQSFRWSKNARDGW